MSGWTHRDGSTEHTPDPHYNGNGLPTWWTCHAKIGKERCDGALLLDGRRPPITVALTMVTDAAESRLSAQP